MIVCQCTGTTDNEIMQLRSEGVTTTAAVTHATGAGSCCDSCRVEIGRILGEHSSAAPGTSPASVG